MNRCLTEFLASQPNILTVIFDQQCNMILPEDPGARYFAKSLKKIEGNVYYSPEYNMWLERTEFDFWDPDTNYQTKYRVISYMNMTKRIEKEHSYEIDRATGISIRRKLLEDFKAYLEHAIKHQEELAMVITDLDYFKSVNDNYSHLAGDKALETAAQGILHNTRQAWNLNKRSNRPKDIVGRYGGDEFVYVLKNIEDEPAFRRPEEIRSIVSSTPVDFTFPNDGAKVQIPITMSAGIVHVNKAALKKLGEPAFEKDDAIKLIIETADECLSEAKAAGKNRSVYKSLSI